MDIHNIGFISEWEDDLIWCPSQLERQFTNPITKKINTLYCRWRHSDPWSFSFYQLKPYFTVELGEGLSEYSSIKDIHTFAEKLLLEYFRIEFY